MDRMRQLAIVVTLLLSLLAPTMACSLPNAQMTAQEHACCQKMKGNCGSMKMPASHSCCGQSMQATHFDAALQPESVSASAVAVIAALPSPQVVSFHVLTYERVIWQQHSPPISPPPAVSVLRI
jgi:hypothetical protein